MTDKNYKFDVFLNYSQTDQETVKEFAKSLRASALRVAFIDRVGRPASEPSHDIENAIDESRVMLFFAPQHPVSDEWSQLVKRSLKFRDPVSKERRFIPIRVGNAPIPESFRHLELLEWVDGQPDLLARLVAVCTPPKAKPTARGAGAPRTSPKNRYKPNLTAHLRSAVFAADLQTVIIGSRDGTIQEVEFASPNVAKRQFSGHRAAVFALNVNAENALLVSGSNDGALHLWDTLTGQCVRTFPQSAGAITSVVLAGETLISSAKGEPIHVWDSKTTPFARELRGHIGDVFCIAIANSTLVSGGADGTVRVWNWKTGQCIRVLEGHTGSVHVLKPNAEGTLLLSGSRDCTVKLWDLDSGLCLSTFDAHTDTIRHLAWHPEERVFASAGDDRDVRLWGVETGTLITILEGNASDLCGIALGEGWVVAADSETFYRWQLPSRLMPQSQGAANTSAIQREEQVQYTNAKVLLVGDSGAGKTGLSKRLADGTWESSPASTVGAWATQWSIPATGTQQGDREIWLWDFGGQADQRLIHQLYMDETALAVLVFDAQKPHVFQALAQWDRDLSRSSERPVVKLLVAGRTDASAVPISQKEIQEFVQQYGYTDYLETSALTGKNCAQLKEAIVNNIDWTSIPWRSSPILFKRLKEEIVRLKDEGRVLMRFNELRDSLRLRLPASEINFTDAELKAVLSLLAGPGVVAELDFGAWVLFQPELINAYSQAVIATMRDDPSELGCVSEQRVLSGDLVYGGFERIDPEDERFVLLAMHRKLLQRGLCARELTEKDVLLVFPSYYKKSRPALTGHPAVLVSYLFEGITDELYSTLVVQLDHTHRFKREHLWQDAAEFSTDSGQRIGVKLVRQFSGGADAVEIYCDPKALLGEKIIFVKYVHDHLTQRAGNVTRRRHYVCPNCAHPIADLAAAGRRLASGMADIGCATCDFRVELLDELEKLYSSDETNREVKRLESLAHGEMDNESKERLLVGDVMSKVALARQISREKSVGDHGIDMEIEFKKDDGTASGQLIFLQLKSGDSYIRTLVDGREIFTIKNPRHSEYWANQVAPVMLVIRNSDGEIRWMEIRGYLREKRKSGKKVTQIEFNGSRFDAESIAKWRESVLSGRVQH